MSLRLPPRRLVIGSPISTTSYAEVLDLVEHRPTDRATTFFFCNVHSIVEATRDEELRAAIADVDVATSDGVPLVWALRRLGAPEQQRVYGPDLMELALPHGVERGWRHYMFGSTDQTLDALVAAAERLAPGVQVVGRHAPPFRPQTDDELEAVLADVRASGTDCLWVGLGMPKQEKWVHQVADRLPGVAVLAVGAAFDLLGGTVDQAPDVLQDRGLEWAYRLYKEPRRLWRRYASTNPRFVAAVGSQLLGRAALRR